MIKNIVTIVGLILLVVFGYYLIVLEDSAVQSGNREVVTNAQLETQDFLRRLNDIQTINLQTDVLDDPRFTNRIDYSSPVPVVPVGRENPFVPAN